MICGCRCSIRLLLCCWAALGIGCTAELQTGKDNEVFYLWVYDIFENQTLAIPFPSFLSSLVINSNIRKPSVLLNVELSVLNGGLKRQQTRTSEQLKTTENNLSGLGQYCISNPEST